MKSTWQINSPFGSLWIAEENKAITHLQFSKDDLLTSYNYQNTPLIQKASSQLAEYFQGRRQDFDLPIAPRGTDFQKSVWQKLQNIPYGKTCSYKDIAISLGNHNASRAVGNANNKNPIAIIIPCHRVIGQNGSLVGYAGGLHIKKYLLELETNKYPYFEYTDIETNHLKKNDAKLATAIDKIGHIFRPVIPDIYMALVKTIIGQQISTKAQNTIWQRINGDISPINPDTIGEMTIEKIQSYGISKRKATYIKEMTTSILEGSLNLEKLQTFSDDEVIDYLTKIKGIGTWTAEMLMIFSMQRPDILSYGDLAIHRGLRMLYNKAEINLKDFISFKNTYSPYSSVASLYLWKIAGGALPELIDPATMMAE